MNDNDTTEGAVLTDSQGRPYRLVSEDAWTGCNTCESCSYFSSELACGDCGEQLDGDPEDLVRDYFQAKLVLADLLVHLEEGVPLTINPNYAEEDIRKDSAFADWHSEAVSMVRTLMEYACEE